MYNSKSISIWDRNGFYISRLLPRPTYVSCRELLGYKSSYGYSFRYSTGGTAPQTNRKRYTRYMTYRTTSICHPSLPPVRHLPNNAELSHTPPTLKSPQLLQTPYPPSSHTLNMNTKTSTISSLGLAGSKRLICCNRNVRYRLDEIDRNTTTVSSTYRFKRKIEDFIFIIRNINCVNERCTSTFMRIR